MDIFSKLGFDLNSIIQYVVNFGILFGALSYLLYPKILHFLDERRKIIADNLQEANSLKEVFEKKLAEIEHEKQQTHAALKAEMEASRNLLETRREEMMKELEGERSKMLEEAQKQITAQQNNLIKETEEHMMKLMKTIILHIVRNKVPEKTIQESIQDSWLDYKKTA